MLTSCNTARWLARVAVEVYRSTPKLWWLPGSRFEYHEVDNFELILVWFGEHLIVAFRGSDERLDWKYNLRFYPVLDARAPGRWHRGFLAGAKRVVTLVAPYVAQHNGKVWLVGHSLGGALAGVVAALFAVSGRERKVAGVLQIGAPRMCTLAAARWLSEIYRSRWLRATNPADRVPHLPPAVFGYRHVGTKLRLPAARRPWWVLFWPGRFLGDHKVTRYLRRLDACAKSIGPEV